MVFGKTKEHREHSRLWRLEWHKAYAWLPVPLTDGRWAWLQPVERISYFASEIRASAPKSLSFWCYRLPATELGRAALAEHEAKP